MVTRIHPLKILGLTTGLALALLLWLFSSPSPRPSAPPSPSSASAVPTPAAEARASRPILPPELRSSAEAPPAEPAEPDPALEERLVTQILTEANEAFASADLETATELFQRIVDRYPDTPQAPYAAYKLAWCRFNEGDRVEAIRSLELLASWLESSEVPNGEALAKSARQDLEMFRTTDDEPPNGVIPGQDEEE